MCGHRQAKGFFFFFFFYSSAKRAGGLFSLSSNQLTILTGLLTGHCNLKGHWFKLGLANSPMCDRCKQASETAAHILCDCVALATLRFRMCHYYLKSGDFEDISVSRTLHSVQGAGLLNAWAKGLQKRLKKVKVTVMPTLLYSILFCSIPFYSMLSFFYDYIMTPWLFMVIVGICEMQATNVYAYRSSWRKHKAKAHY